MRKGILILNGNLCNIDNSADITVCADGGLTNAVKCGIIPDIVIGDFDSNTTQIPPKAKLIEFNSDKDKTDGELGLDYLISNKYNHIDIYCALGGRLDHQLMNINLLYIAYKKGVSATIIDDNMRAFIVSDTHSFDVKVNDYVSLLPFTDTAHIINSTGLRYSTNNIIVDKSTSLTVSNIAVSDTVTLQVADGLVLVVICSP